MQCESDAVAWGQSGRMGEQRGQEKIVLETGVIPMGVEILEWHGRTGLERGVREVNGIALLLPPVFHS